MTSHMTLLPVTIIRKVCICTVFVFLILVLHLNNSLNQGNRVQTLLSRLSPSQRSSSPSSARPDKTRLPRYLEQYYHHYHQFHHNPHQHQQQHQHRSSLPLRTDQFLQLPPPFRVIHVSNQSSTELQPQLNSLHRQQQYNHKNEKENNNTQAAPFNCPLSKCEPSFTICVYDTSVDRFISGALLSGGIWEPYITSAFQSALSNHPDATVIDIGANIGYYSLMSSSRGHDVIAVEPYKENQRRLAAGSELTARQYKDAGRVVLLANAMSDGHRFVGLSKSNDNQGALRVLEDCHNGTKGILGFFKSLYSYPYHARSGVERGTPCDIPTLTLDDLLLVLTARKAIIKVDIEGYECRALGQASRLFASTQVPYIFTEWRLMTERQRDADTACPAHRIRQLATTLSDLGFVPHEVQSGIRLNPSNAPQWHVGDVYWRQKDRPLLVPSM